jgi:hypothetical protein
MLMTGTPPGRPPLLRTARAAFLVGPVAINVASRSATLAPSIARAYGCRVSGDRRQIVVFLSSSRSEAVLRDLAEGTPIAVIFSRPKTHESLQLKGERANVRPLEPGDRERMRRYGEAFAAEICALGYPAELAQALLAGVDEDAVGVGFEPSALFEQTPGPHAGERLEPKA